MSHTEMEARSVTDLMLYSQQLCKLFHYARAIADNAEDMFLNGESKFVKLFWVSSTAFLAGRVPLYNNKRKRNKNFRGENRVGTQSSKKLQKYCLKTHPKGLNHQIDVMTPF